MMRLRRFLPAILAMSFIASFAPVCDASSSRALPKGPGCSDADVTASAILIGSPRPVGYPVVGFTMGLEGRLLKFHVEFAAGAGICRPPDEVHSLDKFSWTVTDPLGVQVTLADEETLTPRFTLSVQGVYHVRLRPCPEGCTIQTAQGIEIFVPPLPFKTLTITAVPSAPLAPESVPVLPPSALSPTAKHTLAANHCSFDAGVTAAQWFAVEQIDGPQDYKWVEGTVESSRVSRKDTPFNHGFQDTNYHVKPDPPFNYILHDYGPFDPAHPQIQADLEIEWERSLIPEAKRPTQGDRISAFGEWVYDCGHGAPFEIHPPVGVAVHRSRPILIPTETTFDEFRDPDGRRQGVGSGVYVPGIVSDLWFSTHGGKLTDCSVDTGLLNANLLANTTLFACVPAPSLDRTFTFNIYLPRNPQQTMHEAGLGAPAVPLYVATSDSPSFSARPPQIVRRTEAGITWLEVTLDLRGYPEDIYEGKIVAGWVLPAANNWGLAPWKLRLKQLHVLDSGRIQTPQGVAWLTWRLWVNTNNARSVASQHAEWVKILDQPVAEGDQTFDNQPWETEAAIPERDLGPNLLKYPAPEIPAIPGPRDPGILIHITGYQDQTLTDDDAGTVNRFLPPTPATPDPFHNQCAPTSDAGGLVYSGCVEYTATVETAPGTPLAPALVNPAAQAIADRYVLRCSSTRTGDPGECAHVLAPPVEPTVTHPFEVPLEPGSGALSFTAVSSFSRDELEGGLTEGSISEFYEAVVKTRQTDPARADRMLTNLRAVIDESLSDKSTAHDVSGVLDVVKVALPRDLWARYFGDLQPTRPDPESTTGSLTGGGVIASVADRVQISGLQLHCARERTPNGLVVRWGRNRFDLDLVMSGTCALGTHEGVGVGRYNGVPGAVIRWRFVDGGEPGVDAGAITIVLGSDEAAIVLDVAGSIQQGNLQMHER